MARRNARSVTETLVIQQGSLRYLGTIDFTATSKTNAQATTPFSASGMSGKTLILQTTQDVYILPVPTSTTVISATDGFLMYAGETKSFHMDDPDTKSPAGELYAWLAAIRVTADGNLKVWEMI